MSQKQNTITISIIPEMESIIERMDNYIEEYPHLFPNRTTFIRASMVNFIERWLVQHQPEKELFSYGDEATQPEEGIK